MSSLVGAPALSRATASTCSDSAGSAKTNRLSPWRRAFRPTLALPRAVLGPVLVRALARLVLFFRRLVMHLFHLLFFPRSFWARQIPILIPGDLENYGAASA